MKVYSDRLVTRESISYGRYLRASQSFRYFTYRYNSACVYDLVQYAYVQYECIVRHQHAMKCPRTGYSRTVLAPVLGRMHLKDGNGKGKARVGFETLSCRG